MNTHGFLLGTGVIEYNHIVRVKSVSPCIVLVGTRKKFSVSSLSLMAFETPVISSIYSKVKPEGYLLRGLLISTEFASEFSKGYLWIKEDVYT